MLSNYSILLADDDEDDRILFEEALKEVSKDAQLTTVADGQQLIDSLKEAVIPAPDVIFLDLNMPIKNGLECLVELKSDQKFKHFPIVIVSTTAEMRTINKAYEFGANYYIRKPGAFPQLKNLIGKVMQMNWYKEALQPSRENFVLMPE